MVGLSLPSLHRPTSQPDQLDNKTKKGLASRISFWKRRTHNITECDPQYRVVYLGNVLTGWAKGKKSTQKHTINTMKCSVNCVKLFPMTRN